jgi:hypothetical protein
MLASIQRIDLPDVDSRGGAEPLAILSPAALTVSAREIVMSCVSPLREVYRTAAAHPGSWHAA